MESLATRTQRVRLTLKPARRRGPIESIDARVPRPPDADGPIDDGRIPRPHRRRFLKGKRRY